MEIDIYSVDKYNRLQRKVVVFLKWVFLFVSPLVYDALGIYIGQAKGATIVVLTSLNFKTGYGRPFFPLHHIHTLEDNSDMKPLAFQIAVFGD